MNHLIFDLPAYIFDRNSGPLFLLFGTVIMLLLGRITKCRPSMLHSACFLFIFLAFVLALLAQNHSALITGLSFSPLYHVGVIIILVALMALHALLLKEDVGPERKLDLALLVYVSALGGLTALASANWMMFFIGIQCLSLPIFGMLAINTDEKSEIQSSLRYLILSSVAIAFMLFGIALLYAESGVLDFVQQRALFKNLTPSTFSLTLLGVSMILIGIGFKLSLAPFHVWTPSVFQGTRIFSLCYLVIVAKTVVILFLLHHNWIFLSLESTAILSSLYCIAILSMWLGSLLMLIEQNFTRFIAYLSISHLGFLLIPLLSQHEFASVAIILDLMAFSLALILLLAILQKSFSSIHTMTLHDLKSFAHKKPALGFIVAICCASLAGVPLTAGFIAKYTVVLSGALSDQWFLLINMILSSVISLYALLRIIIFLYMDFLESPIKRHYSLGTTCLVMLASTLIIFGIAPDFWLTFVRSQVHAF